MPGLDDATRARLEHELARVREERRRLAVQLAGEDPDDPDVGDRGDDALRLEGADDVARLEQRIDELERLLTEGGATPGLPDGTLVTLRFPDGDEATYRVVAIPEEEPGDDQDEVLTSDSPLGRALVGHQAGDTVTYEGPDGALQAEVVALTGG
jgi:transcription elongation factor GreA